MFFESSSPHIVIELSVAGSVWDADNMKIKLHEVSEAVYVFSWVKIISLVLVYKVNTSLIYLFIYLEPKLHFYI